MMGLNTLLIKSATCFIAGLTFAALLLILGNSGSIAWFPPVVVFSLVGITMLTALVFPFAWQYKERRQQINTTKIYSFLHAFTCYCIAFNLASFGWKKILGLQFIVPADIASQPMNQQTGEWLTWYYFGYSAAYGLIIAAIQIIGSYMLLFRKTELLALLILFSFMLNLLLVNIFYGMNAGALMQSVVLTIAILFLLLQHYKKLTAFVLNTQSSLPSFSAFKPTIKNSVRLSAILLALLFTVYLKMS